MATIVVLLFLAIPIATAAATTGIVVLARRLSAMRGEERVLAIVGIFVLAGFALAGMAAIGCTAMLVYSGAMH